MVVDCYGRLHSDGLPELERLVPAYDLDYEGWAIHYTSVGLRDGPAHLTVYAQPAGYAIE